MTSATPGLAATVVLFESMFGAVCVQTDDQSRWLIAPFGRNSAGKAIVVDPHHVAATDRDGREYVVLDARSRTVRSRRRFDDNPLSVCVPRPGLLVFPSWTTQALDGRTLETLWSTQVPFYAKAIVARQDGSFVLSDGRDIHLLLGADGAILDEPGYPTVKGSGFLSVSPCGRWLVRQDLNDQRLLWSDGAPVEDRAALLALSAEDPIGFLERTRSLAYVSVLEIWSPRPFVRLRQVETAAIAFDDKFDIDEMLERFRHPPQGSTPAGLRLVLDAYVASVVAILRNEPPDYHWGPPVVRSIRWSDDGDRFQLEFERRGKVPRLIHVHPADGRVDDQPWDALRAELTRPPLYVSYEAVADAFDALLHETIPLPALDESACIQALDTMDSRFGAGDLRRGPTLRFRFETPTGFLSEPTFFNHLADHCPAAVPALRALLQRHGWYAHAHYDNTSAALGHAALALARMDLRAYEVLGKWFDSADNGHEEMSATQVLPALAANLDQAPRKAFAVVLGWAVRGPADPSQAVVQAIMRAARGRMSALAFVRELLGATRPADVKAADADEVDTWRFHHSQLFGTIAMLRPLDGWDRKVMSLCRAVDRLTEHRLWPLARRGPLARWLPPQD